MPAIFTAVRETIAKSFATATEAVNYTTIIINVVIAISSTTATTAAASSVAKYGSNCFAKIFINP